MSTARDLAETIPYEDARDLVETFFFDVALSDSADRDFAELALAHPETTRAALAYLQGRYVGRQPAVEPWESLAGLPGVLAKMVARGGAAAQGSLVGLALMVADTADLRILGEIVMHTVEPDLLARLLLAGLESDPMTQFRASELAYHSIDASAGTCLPSDDLALVLNERLRIYHRHESTSQHPVP
ncbi:MAG TPA: hypothetical protein PK095_00295 [Myxococcota bacterium]|nr:hypothetical protein [Myxococcota bacterium]